MATSDEIYNRMTPQEQQRARQIFEDASAGRLTPEQTRQAVTQNEARVRQQLAGGGTTSSTSGGDGGGGGGSSSNDCPPGYKKNEYGKCVPIDTSSSGGRNPNLFGPAYEELPVEEEVLPAQDAYLEFLQQQAEQQRQQARESARVVIGDLLSLYGLGDLTDFVNDLIFKEDIVDAATIIGKIKTDKGTAGKTYWARFAGNRQRLDAGRNVLSEAEYLAVENAYRQVMRSAGLPQDLFDRPDDLANLIGYDVSVAELNARINDGFQAVARANPEVKAQMQRLYGVSDATLAAYFLDPERATPVLLRQAQSAQIAGQAKLQAQQEVTAAQAEELAIAGVSEAEARQGFQTIAQAQEIFNPLILGETAITQEEQIAGVFGTSAAAQQRIRQRQRERQAAFETGGRFAGQGTTVTGLQ